MSEIHRSLRVLGLEPGASSREIVQAYKDLVRVWHPDRLGSDADLQARAQEKLKEITRAYETLQAAGYGAGRAGRTEGRRPAGSPPPRRPAAAPGPRPPGLSESIPGWVWIAGLLVLIVAVRSGRIFFAAAVALAYIVAIGLRRMMRPGA